MDKSFSSNFDTRKAVAPFSNIHSSWADQYSSIDTWNIRIRPLVIILWRNILGHQQVALNSLLTTIPNRNFYCKHCSSLILYCSRIRKNVTYIHTEKRQIENREQKTEKPITEATVIWMDRWVEWAINDRKSYIVNIDFFYYCLSYYVLQGSPHFIFLYD